MALEIRERYPGTAVLVLSQYVELGLAMKLLSDSAEGTAGLLKDRIGDALEFVDAVRRVLAIDPQIVSKLLSVSAPTIRSTKLTPREREVLELMASGKSNHGIAESLVISVGAVEKYAFEHLREARTRRPAPNRDGCSRCCCSSTAETAASRHQKTRPPIAGHPAFGARTPRGC